MQNETELIERAKSGDQEAFCRLAQGYQRRVYLLALHYCQDPHDAEDLSQDVWLKAFRAISGFRGESSFHTWLRQITINTFLNHQRGTAMMFGKEKKAIRLGKLVSLDELGLAEPSRNAEEEMHDRMLTGQVMESLGELTPQQRLIFVLKHCEGMTYDEISHSCEVSSGTIKKALFRAVDKLRGRLGARPLGAAAAAGAHKTNLQID